MHSVVPGASRPSKPPQLGRFHCSQHYESIIMVIVLVVLIGLGNLQEPGSWHGHASGQLP